MSHYSSLADENKAGDVPAEDAAFGLGDQRSGLAQAVSVRRL